jgi:hypothetical protein
MPLGAFDVTLDVGNHCPPDRFPGTITEPPVPPVRASAYRCGEAWSTLIHHRPSDRSLLVVGSAGFVHGALRGQRADVVYLGVGQLGLQPGRHLRAYWDEAVRALPLLNLLWRSVKTCPRGSASSAASDWSPCR